MKTYTKDMTEEQLIVEFQRVFKNYWKARGEYVEPPPSATIREAWRKGQDTFWGNMAETKNLPFGDTEPFHMPEIEQGMVAIRNLPFGGTEVAKLCLLLG